jgi:hypothetical protein
MSEATKRYDFGPGFPAIVTGCPGVNEFRLVASTAVASTM